MRFAVAGARTKGDDRSTRFDQMRAREIDCGLELDRERRRQPAVSLRRLELHQDRGESLRKVVVDIAREAVALLENAFAPLFEAAFLGQAALMQRQRRLTRNRLDQDD